ncbi:MAG: triose-phosphate isomerase [Bacteroidetes bacterium]|nr:triose-phosphate isomerase [Bacteroidota bacterium]
MRKQIAAANWKMNLEKEKANELVESLISEPVEMKDNHAVILGVPAVYLNDINEKIKNIDDYFVAAQDCSSNNNGAFTGEISCSILASIGVKYAIIGHSERRMYHNESNSLLAEKVDRAFENNIIPIFCCGEPLNIREAGTQNNYVEVQISESLFHLPAEKIKTLVIAYEPIWAIGTGKTATEQQAQEIHKHIRNFIAAKYGNDVAESISILYGGSVKGSNASSIFSQPDVDGGLVGGASLKADEFKEIIKGLK